MLRWVVLLIFAGVHAYLFLYGWHFFGSPAGSAALGATNSFLLSAVAEASVAAGVTTLPLAFIAGYVCGVRLLLAACALFPLGWVVFRCAVGGVPYHAANIATLLVEVLAILAACAVAFRFGVLVHSRWSRHGAVA